MRNAVGYTFSCHNSANRSSPQARKEKRGVIFKRAESYVKEYRDAEREKIRLSRLAKQEGNFYVPAEPKLVFVIRIKGVRLLYPRPIYAQLPSLNCIHRSIKWHRSPGRLCNSSVCCKSTTAYSSSSPKPPPRCSKSSNPTLPMDFRA